MAAALGEERMVVNLLDCNSGNGAIQLKFSKLVVGVSSNTSLLPLKPAFQARPTLGLGSNLLAQIFT